MGSRQNPSNPQNVGHDPANIYSSSPLGGRGMVYNQVRTSTTSRLPYASASARNQPLNGVQIAQLQPQHRTAQVARSSRPQPTTPNYAVQPAPQGPYDYNPAPSNYPANYMHHPPTPTSPTTAPEQHRPYQRPAADVVTIPIPDLFARLEGSLLNRLGTFQAEFDSVKTSLNQIKDDVQRISQVQTSIQQVHSDAFKDIDDKAAALQLAIGESKLGYGADKSRTIMGRLDDMYLALGDIVEKMADEAADAYEMERSTSNPAQSVEHRSVGTSPMRSIWFSRAVDARTPTPPRVLATAQVGTTPFKENHQRPTSSLFMLDLSYSAPDPEAYGQDIDMADLQANESVYQADAGPSQPSFITSSPKPSGDNNVVLRCKASPIQRRDSQFIAGFSPVDWNTAIPKPQTSPELPPITSTCRLSGSFSGPLETEEPVITIQQPKSQAQRTNVPANEPDQDDTDQEHLLEAGMNAMPSPATTERSTIPDLQYPTRETTADVERHSQVPVEDGGTVISHRDQDQSTDEDHEDTTVLKKDGPLSGEESQMTPKSLTTTPQPVPSPVLPIADPREISYNGLRLASPVQRDLDAIFGSELSSCPSSHPNHRSPSMPYSTLSSLSQTSGVSDASKLDTLSRASTERDTFPVSVTSPKPQTGNKPRKSVDSEGDGALSSSKPKSVATGADPAPVIIERDPSSMDVISSPIPDRTREAEEMHEAETEESTDDQLKTPVSLPVELPSSAEIAHIDAELTAPSDDTDIDEDGMDEELDQLLPSSQVSEVDEPSSFTSQPRPSSIKTIPYTSSTDGIKSVQSIAQLSSIQQSPSGSNTQVFAGSNASPSVSEKAPSSVRENPLSTPNPLTPKAPHGLTSPLSSVPSSGPPLSRSPSLQAINPAPSTPAALPNYISPVNSPTASPRPSTAKKSYKRKFDESQVLAQAQRQSLLQSAQKGPTKEKGPSVISPTPYRVAPRPFKRTVRVEDALGKNRPQPSAEAGTSKSAGHKKGNETSPIVISSASTSPTSAKPKIIDLTDSPSIIRMWSNSVDTSAVSKGKEKERLIQERRGKDKEKRKEEDQQKQEKEEQERRMREKKREKEKKLLPVGADDSDDAEIIPARSFKVQKLPWSSEDGEGSEAEDTSATQKPRKLASSQILIKEQPRVDFRKLVTKQKKESRAMTKVKRKGRASNLYENDDWEGPPLKRARIRLNSAESDSAGPASGLKEIRRSSRKSTGSGIEKNDPLDQLMFSAGGVTRQQAESSSSQKHRHNTGAPNKPVKWPSKKNGDNAFQRRFILCDLCNLWYHYGCVAIRPGDNRLKDTEIFTCPPCEAIGCPADPNPFRNRAKSPGDSCNRPDCAFRKAESPGNEYFVKRIIGRRSRMVGGRGRVEEWFVEWDGYPVSEATWETRDAMNDPDQLTEEFMIAAKKEGLDLDRDPYATVLLKIARKSKC